MSIFNSKNSLKTFLKYLISTTDKIVTVLNRTIKKLQIYYCTKFSCIQLVLYNMNSCRRANRLELKIVLADGGTYLYVFESCSVEADIVRLTTCTGGGTVSICKRVHLVNLYVSLQSALHL